MIRLDEALHGAIAQETRYHQLVASLRRINPARFRALGEVNCRRLVAHAGLEGDNFGLMTVGGRAYLLLIMNWLGAYFLDDPRYDAIRTALSGLGSEEDRLARARKAFMAIGDRQIGPDAAILRERLTRLPEVEPLMRNPDISHSVLHDALLELWDLSPAERENWPRRYLEGQALKATQYLHIDTSFGRRLALVLTHVLGVRFYEDPLYPWVADIVRQAREQGRAPDQALGEYARKRLNALLRNSDEEDVNV
ncbi:hypothetical protein [Paracoccus sp. (in: a-proteobacteria)]|uniref:hypothetical protein n=1 Tax=Paracoccus sp. TaxID=267 RepID=UPI00289E44F2|nr:hypothetical protein [Paracoccus sp. (in: a-proteobacteria)]